MRVNGIDCNGLVYTGATRTVISKRIYLLTKGDCMATFINGSKVACKETVEVDIQVQGGAVIKTSCLSVDMNIPFDALVGMYIYNRLNGIQISRGSVKFLGDATVIHHVSASHVSSKRQMPSVSIRDDDFSAIFDGNSWSCKWVWKNGEPEKLYNSIASYSIDSDLQKDFEKEVNCWIREGWLIPYDGELYWKRDNKPLDSDVQTTKRQLFSFCTKVIGHFPVCGLLRPSCSYLKRLCNDIGRDDPIPKNVMKLIENLIVKLREYDPVQGK
ncbi:hypothetical protein GJ496_011194 [Pomphorhynchus laevis]|nr:hypothetical protein GJ496_011194 [Pomphorhynchus laevis]